MRRRVCVLGECYNENKRSVWTREKSAGGALDGKYIQAPKSIWFLHTVKNTLDDRHYQRKSPVMRKTLQHCNSNKIPDVPKQFDDIKKHVHFVVIRF